MDSIEAFEWDETKRGANVAKHGIDFVDAVQVFGDPRQLTYRSSHHSGEERFVSIGAVHGKLIAVVFTQRANKVRIISARAARRVERELYDK